MRQRKFEHVQLLMSIFYEDRRSVASKGNQSLREKRRRINHVNPVWAFWRIRRIDLICDVPVHPKRISVSMRPRFAR